jgi:nitrate reductase beta subunit
LLIGNFVRTIVEGTSDSMVLYPHFTPYVAKYADNGLARTDDEVAAYLRTYRARAPIEYLRHRLTDGTRDRVRARLRQNAQLYRGARRVYQRVTRRGQDRSSPARTDSA